MSSNAYTSCHQSKVQKSGVHEAIKSINFSHTLDSSSDPALSKVFRSQPLSPRMPHSAIVATLPSEVESSHNCFECCKQPCLRIFGHDGGGSGHVSGAYS